VEGLGKCSKKKSCTEKTAAKENGARWLNGSHGEKFEKVLPTIQDCV